MKAQAEWWFGTWVLMWHHIGRLYGQPSAGSAALWSPWA